MIAQSKTVKREGAVVRACTQRLPSHILSSAKIVKSGGEPNLFEHAAAVCFSEDSERWSRVRQLANLHVRIVESPSIAFRDKSNFQGIYRWTVIYF